jgi:hypothetical protein
MMLGRWFRPKPPLATSSRVEIDRLLIEISGVTSDVNTAPVRNRTIEQFNIGRALDQDSPAALSTLHEIVRSVCNDHQLDPNRVKVVFVDETDDGSFVQFQDSMDANSIGHVSVALDLRLKTDSLRCIVCIAQAVARADWFAKTGQWPSDLLTDLRVITMGFGSMAAEAFLYDKTWSVAAMQGWNLSRIGVLSSVEIGYAMATWDRRTSSISSDTAAAMRLDARHAMLQTRRYYQSLAGQPVAGQSTLIDQPRLPMPQIADADLSQLWIYGEATRVYESALQTKNQMSESQSKIPAILHNAVMHLMKSSDIDLVTVATRLCGFCDLDRDTIEKVLLEKLRSKQNSVFLAAVASSLDHGFPISNSLKRLQSLVNIQANQQFVTLDLIDRSRVSSPELINCLQRQLALAERCDDTTYHDRLQKTLGLMK